MNKPRSHRAWIWLGAAAMLAACSPSALEEQPTPPDMSSLLQVYEAPTGDFNQTQARSLLTTALVELELINDSGVFDTLFGAIDDALEAEEGAQKPGLQVRRQPLTLNGEGFVRIRRVCAGADGGEPDEATNGLMRLTMNFNQDGIHPVVWGQAQDCLYSLQGEQVALRGNLQVHLGASAIDRIGAAPLLVRVGELEITSRDLSQQEVDFRLDLETSALELRVPASNGDVVVVFGADDLRVRAANGEFTCDLEADTCTSSQTGTFSL